MLSCLRSSSTADNVVGHLVIYHRCRTLQGANWERYNSGVCGVYRVRPRQQAILAVDSWQYAIHFHHSGQSTLARGCLVDLRVHALLGPSEAGSGSMRSG